VFLTFLPVLMIIELDKIRMEQSPIPNAECTLCDHDLDNYALRVCTHPRIPVPVCLLCLEEVTDKLLDDDESVDQCSWCGDNECGTLFICGDGSKCKNSFCEDCLERNLGQNFVSSLKSEEDWLCLVCNPEQLSKLTIAMKACAARSMYEIKFKGSELQQNASSSTANAAASDESEVLNEDGDDELIARLKVVIEVSTMANRALEDESIMWKEQEIREECMGSRKSQDDR
jgi:hypothetical protein